MTRIQCCGIVPSNRAIDSDAGKRCALFAYMDTEKQSLREVPQSGGIDQPYVNRDNDNRRDDVNRDEQLAASRATLEDMTVPELRKMADEESIDVSDCSKKEEIINTILHAQAE